MKFRRTLALTLILTLLLSLFCGCEKKETQKKKVSSKPKTSQKELSAAELYDKSNELLENHNAYQLSENVKAKLVEGEEETEFKMDIELISSGEKDKNPAFYNRNVISVGTVLAEQTTTYVDGVCYVKEIDALYRQKMTPDEFIAFYDKEEEDNGEFSLNYFEKTEISGKKAKTIKYSAPKKDNLDELSEYFSDIIEGFFDGGDITDASGEVTLGEDGAFSGESIRIIGTAHSEGKLGEFDIEMKVSVDKLDEEVDAIVKPADANSYVEVKSVEAALDATHALSDLFGKEDSSYNLNFKYDIKISNESVSNVRTVDVQYKYNNEGVVHQLYVKGKDVRTTPEEKNLSSDHTVDYSGNSIRLNMYFQTKKVTPTDKQVEEFLLMYLLPSAPIFTQLTATSQTEKGGKRTINYSASNEDFENWGSSLLIQNGTTPDSIKVKSGGNAYFVLNEDDEVVSTYIKKSFTITVYGQTADFTVEVTRTNK